ncbi:hypothetical protein AVEN_103479-1 [Araneus ventricosus]|uniref:Uncharacterized protein n=1 Tax=Araneus ventricosus TaxID=182803 RepID=A0A4Y2J097_ARAVE|nr:hypothetical protein AVEN_103479-1 [Araneus ventricosus]
MLTSPNKSNLTLYSKLVNAVVRGLCLAIIHSTTDPVYPRAYAKSTTNALPPSYTLAEGKHSYHHNSKFCCITTPKHIIQQQRGHLLLYSMVCMHPTCQCGPLSAALVATPALRKRPQLRRDPATVERHRCAPGWSRTSGCDPRHSVCVCLLLECLAPFFASHLGESPCYSRIYKTGRVIPLHGILAAARARVSDNEGGGLELQEDEGSVFLIPGCHLRRK